MSNEYVRLTQRNTIKETISACMDVIKCWQDDGPNEVNILITFKKSDKSFILGLNEPEIYDKTFIQKLKNIAEYG